MQLCSMNKHAQQCIADVTPTVGDAGIHTARYDMYCWLFLIGITFDCRVYTLAFAFPTEYMHVSCLRFGVTLRVKLRVSSRYTKRCLKD